MIVDRVDEPSHVVVGPRLGLALEIGLGDVTGHADSCRPIAADGARSHGVLERCAQHHAQDADAPPGAAAAGGEFLEPASDVVAIESVEADGAEVACDPLRRPFVLQSGLVSDLDAARGPLREGLPISPAAVNDAAAPRAARSEE